MDKKFMIELGDVDFYITNVCNLNCEECLTLNNYAFKGHLKWEDHAEIYEQWSKILTCKKLSIMGGEPTLNPDLLNWVRGISKLWPNINLTIVTNGTQLHKWPELYDLIKESNNRIFLRVCLHGGESEKLAYESIDKFFKGKTLKSKKAIEIWESKWKAIKGSDWPNCTIDEFEFLPEHIKKECREQFDIDPINFKWDESKYFTDDNGVEIFIEPNEAFHPSPVVFDKSIQNLRFYNSDPKKAFDVCGYKVSKCTKFFKGKLYKCGPLPILQDFVDQFSMKLSDSDMDLLNSYHPAEATWDQNRLQAFVDNINLEQHVDQCKFCPEIRVMTMPSASTKKKKIFNIHSY